MNKSALRKAIDDDNINELYFLVVKSNKGDKSYALKYAIEEGAIPSVRVLLKYGVNLRRDSLPKAIEKGNFKIVDILFGRFNFDINELIKFQGQDDASQTMLMKATKNGNLKLVERLLRIPGIDVNIADTNNCTSLLLAIKAENNASCKIAKALMDAGAKVNCELQKLFDSAVLEGKHDRMKLLYEAGANPNGNDSSKRNLLLQVIERRNFKGIKYLLEETNVDVNQPVGDIDGYTALILAIIQRDHNLVGLLLNSKAGCNINAPDKRGKTPLVWAAKIGSDIIINFLLRAGADINLGDSNNVSPVHYSITARKWKDVGTFLSKGAKLKETLLSKSSLIFAIEDDAPLAVIWPLIDSGLNLNNIGEVKGSYGYSNCDTYIGFAIRRNRADVLGVLLKSGADMRVISEKGRSTIEEAVLSGNENIIRMLVKSGIYVELRNKGKTPLMLAVLEGIETSVKTLLDAGADQNALDSNGRKAIDYAKGREDGRILGLFKEWTASKTPKPKKKKKVVPPLLSIPPMPSERKRKRQDGSEDVENRPTNRRKVGANNKNNNNKSKGNKRGKTTRKGDVVKSRGKGNRWS